MSDVKKYIKSLLVIMTICSCYSTEENKKDIKSYYGKTFQEINKRLIWIIRDIDFKIEHLINYINMQINDIFPNKTQNDITKTFQSNLKEEYSKLKVTLNKIEQIYNESLNTDNKKMNIKDLIVQYRELMFNIDKLIKEYIQQNSSNYYSKTISYLKSYFKNDEYNKELLQELTEFLTKMIVTGKFLYNLWMSFYVEYRRYYGQIFDFSNWEII